MKGKKALARPSEKASKKRLLRVRAKAAPRLTVFERRASRMLGRLAARVELLATRIPRHLETPASWRAITVAAILAVVIVGTTAGIVQSVSAAVYQGPTQTAPGGNIPFTIWNRTASNTVQTNAAIALDGGGPAPASATGITIGLGPSNTSTLDLGIGGGGQNVYYGAALYNSMNAGDDLLKLETDGGASFTTRFSVDRNGNVAASGGIDGVGCFGATFAGTTAAKFQGSLGALGSYYAADAKCAADYPASGSHAAAHICRPEELLESMRCSVAGDPIRVVNGVVAWLNGGPPGHTSNGNDCNGWQDNSGTYLAKVWFFNAATGGTGSMTTCDTPGGLQFACCR